MSMPVTGPWVKELQATTIRSIIQQVVVANKSAAGFWAWICDSAAGALAQSSFAPHYVAPNTREVFEFATSWRLAESGIYVCACPLPSTFGLIPANDCFIEVSHQPNL